ncbi:MAG: hypothetical protein O7G86_01980, partial [Gammaproteobacteria bacterium]|nr:hypothetical protein [Gammaproteobacteria bacterium]
NCYLGVAGLCDAVHYSIAGRNFNTIGQRRVLVMHIADREKKSLTKRVLTACRVFAWHSLA